MIFNQPCSSSARPIPNITPIFNSFFKTKKGRNRPDRPDRPFPDALNGVTGSADRPGIVRPVRSDAWAPLLRIASRTGAGRTAIWKAARPAGMIPCRRRPRLRQLMQSMRPRRGCRGKLFNRAACATRPLSLQRASAAKSRPERGSAPSIADGSGRMWTPVHAIPQWRGEHMEPPACVKHSSYRGVA
jgi:hypothetical protein